MFFFTGHCGFQAAIVVFSLLAGYGFRACTSDRFALVSTHCSAQVSFEIFGHISGYGRFHFSANGSFQILANGVGHVFGSRVHQVLSRIGNRSVFSGILDIRSSLLGVGLVCSISSVGIESFIAQVGGGGVLSIGCGTLDARFCLFRAGQNIAVAILNFLENILQVLGDVRFIGFFSILAGNYRAGFAGCLGGHVGLIPIFYGIDHGVLIVRALAHGAFRIGLRIVPVIRKFLTDAVGSNGTLADGFIVLRPSVAAVFVESRCTGFGFTCRRIFLLIHGLCLAAVNGGVVICIHRAGKSLSIKGSVDGEIFIYSQVAANRSVARSFQRSRCHSAGGLDGSGSYIQPSASNLAAADSAGTYIQALASDVPGHSKVAAYGSIMVDRQCIGSYIAGIDQTIGREGPAYRCIAGSGQGAEGAGNGFTRNISCRNDSMGIDVAGCSQISILEGSYAVCQFISGDGAGSGHVRHTRDCACGRDFHIADFAGCCCDFAICIHGELAICALDGAISLESCLCRISCITAGIETVFVHDSTIQAHFDALIAEGNLVVTTFVHHQSRCRFFGSGDCPILSHAGGVLLQYIVIAQAQSAVDGFHQFGIGCFTGCGFVVDIGLQGRICICTGSCFCGQASLCGKGIIYTIFGVHRLRRIARIRDRHGGVRRPGEVRAQKSCCHQHGCGQFLQSLSCGFALGVAFGDFRCHHIGVLCFAPDDFIDLIHVNPLL